MLDTGSIPVSGTTQDAGKVQSLPAFFIFPIKTRSLRSLASGEVCHIPVAFGGTFGGMDLQIGGIQRQFVFRPRESQAIRSKGATDSVVAFRSFSSQNGQPNRPSVSRREHCLDAVGSGESEIAAASGSVPRHHGFAKMTVRFGAKCTAVVGRKRSSKFTLCQEKGVILKSLQYSLDCTWMRRGSPASLCSSSLS